MVRTHMAPFGFVLCLLLLAGCSGSATRPVDPVPNPPQDPRYAAGEVLVAFHEGVSEQQANALFESYGLMWEPQFSRPFYFWLEVTSGDADAHAAALSQSPIVRVAEVRGNPNGSQGATYIFASFVGQATTAQAEALIGRIPSLRVASRSAHRGYGVVQVEPGTEEDWVTVLKTEPIVLDAGLNYTVTLDGTSPSPLPPPPATDPSRARKDRAPRSGAAAD